MEFSKCFSEESEKDQGYDECRNRCEIDRGRNVTVDSDRGEVQFIDDAAYQDARKAWADEGEDRSVDVLCVISDDAEPPADNKDGGQVHEIKWEKGDQDRNDDESEALVLFREPLPDRTEEKQRKTKCRNDGIYKHFQKEQRSWYFTDRVEDSRKYYRTAVPEPQSQRKIVEWSLDEIQGRAWKKRQYERTDTGISACDVKSALLCNDDWRRNERKHHQKDDDDRAADKGCRREHESAWEEQFQKEIRSDESQSAVKYRISPVIRLRKLESF